MDAGLLKKMFGSVPGWSGPCVILVDGSTSVKTGGPDSLGTGGAKHYAPRVTSGRIEADTVMYNSENSALLAIQRIWTRHHTGEDKVQQTLFVLNGDHIVGLEFDGVAQLAQLGMTAPPVPSKMHYAATTLVG